MSRSWVVRCLRDDVRDVLPNLQQHGVASQRASPLAEFIDFFQDIINDVVLALLILIILLLGTTPLAAAVATEVDAHPCTVGQGTGKRP